MPQYIGDLDISDLDISDLDVGDLDVGDDDIGDEEIGAIIRGAARRRRGLGGMSLGKLAKALATRTAQIVAKDPTHGGTMDFVKRPVTSEKQRTYPIGFGPVTVAAGASAVINVQPQVKFVPQRLIVPQSVAVNFSILDIKVGKDSMFAASGEVPAEAFVEFSFHSGFTFDMAKIAQNVTLFVRNIDTVNPHDFRALVMGFALDD